MVHRAPAYGVRFHALAVVSGIFSQEPTSPHRQRVDFDAVAHGRRHEWWFYCENPRKKPINDVGYHRMKTPKTRGTTIMMTPGRAQPDLTTYAGRFGAHIRAIREKLKLTQQEVADACGVRENTVSQWESGKLFPNSEKIPLISMALRRKRIRDLFPE